MKKIRPNLIVSLGLLILSGTMIAERYFDAPRAISFILLVAAMILELTGIILIARTPEFAKSKAARCNRMMFSRLTGGKAGK